MDHKTITLFGGKPVPVEFEDGRTGEFTVRQFRVREYQAAFGVVDSEAALVALACAVPVTTILGLKEGDGVKPESFEKLYAALKEVNEKGFFTFAARQMARGEQNLKLLPPEILSALMARAKPSTSSMPSPPMPPPLG